MVDDGFSDDIWDQTDDVHNQEWNKMAEEFTNAGYREGITAGKEDSLQEGFDKGFSDIGAPLGREIGRLRGVASACVNLLSSTQAAEHSALIELQDILRNMDQLRLGDILPPDLQAEEHLKGHLKSEEEPQDLSTVANREKHSLAVNNLEELRRRLRVVLKQIGLQLMIS